jgi:hypothetical protein
MPASGGKSRAADFRAGYYQRQLDKGDRLSWIERDYFLDASGCKLGITWSREDNSTWFFNLMQDRFEEAVLLCQVRPDAAIVVHLPKTFINRYWHSLSRDEKGEIKFNIVREHGSFYLRIPQPTGLVDISAFVQKDALNPLERPI